MGLYISIFMSWVQTPLHLPLLLLLPFPTKNNNKKPLWLVWKFRKGGERKGIEERRVVGRRVERNGYHPSCLDVFKISKGEWSN